MRSDEQMPLRQMAASPQLRRIAFFLVAFVVLWHAIGAKATGQTLELSFVEPIHGTAQLYFDEGQGFNGEDVVPGTLQEGGRRVLFSLPHDDSRAYRFDPPLSPARQAITGAVVYSDHGWRLGRVDLESSVAGAQTRLLSRDAGLLRYAIVDGANDPQLLLPAISVEAVVGAVTRANDFGVRFLLVAVLAALLTYIGHHAAGPGTTTKDVVAFGFTAALVVAYAFAVSTDAQRAYNPDEANHFAAANHFLSHSLPPAVLDPATTGTLSVYGYSYLFELDVVYWLAGTLAHYALPDRSIDLMTFRLFNVALLGMLALMAWRSPGARLPLAVLLLTPQAWYIFSYFNADALPLALGLIAVVLSIRPGSKVSQFISAGGRPGLAVAIFVIAVGLLLLSKRNYLPIVPLLGLWLAVRHLRLDAWWAASIMAGLVLVTIGLFLGRVSSLDGWTLELPILLAGVIVVLACAVMALRRVMDDRALAGPSTRLALLFFAACIVAFPRVAYDIHLNGFPSEKAEALRLVAETHAGEGFKPSQVMDAQNQTGVQLANRGVSLGQVALQPYGWISTSANSSFGVFGYMDVHLPAWLYPTFQGLFLAALAGAIYGLWRLQSGMAYLLIAAGISTIVALDSLLHSWTGDFQPQGRYLLPILPVIAAMLAQAGDEAPARWLKPVLVATTLLSVYSMVSHAMPGVGLAGSGQASRAQVLAEVQERRRAAIDDPRGRVARASRPQAQPPATRN